MRLQNRLNRICLIGLVSLCLLLIGCSNSEEPLYTEQVVDGVYIRTYQGATPPNYNVFSFEKSTVFGKGQGSGTYLMASASIIGEAVDGSVLVNDAREYRIHRFTPDGVHISSFGREGDGPGDFGRSYTVVLDGDRLLVIAGSGRISLFTCDGTYLSERRASAVFLGTTVPVGDPQSPHFLFRPAWIFARARGGYSIDLINERLEPVGAVIDTQFVRRSPPDPYIVNTPITAMAPYMPLALSWGDVYLVEFIDPLESARRVTEIPGLSFIGSLLWDQEGRLWVADYVMSTEESESFHFNVFDREGEWLFGQDLPVKPSLITAHGFYVDTEDETGDPVVQYYQWIGDPNK